MMFAPTWICLSSLWLLSSSGYWQGAGWLNNTANELVQYVTPDTNSALLAFVPSGYEVLDSLAADLNADGRSDYLLVLRVLHEDKLIETADSNLLRPLIILLREPNGELKEAARNLNVVLCANCGGVMGDPYVGIRAENGEFTVEHYGGSAWRWSNSVTFQYSPAQRDWFLHRIQSESFHVSSSEKVEKVVKTKRDFGELRFLAFNNYDDEK